MATEFVKTFARIRPSSGTDRPILYADAKTIVCNEKKITFDGAYGPDSQQVDVFDCVGRKIVEGAIDGISGTIFAYGQTGSGKTFTMMGPSHGGEFLLEGDDRGLIPRCIGAAFAKLEERRREMGTHYDFKVFCTFVEIYNENTRDLLSENRQVIIRADQKITIDGAVREEVASDVDALRLVQQGLSARQVGHTAMNNQSSRSHAIFIMEIETEETEDGVSSRRHSRVCMVDLAGSERQQQAQTAGQQLKEAGGINKSLTILARVINILAEKKEGGHVPFRDSKLTLLLRDSLGGNSRTAVIVALHPGPLQERESRSTLQFAECCKKIKNKTVANKIVTGVSIAALQTRIAQLEEANDELTKGKEAVEEELSMARHDIDVLRREMEELGRRTRKPSPSKKARRKTSQHEVRVLNQPTASLWDDDAAPAEEAMDTTVTVARNGDTTKNKTVEIEVARLNKEVEAARAHCHEVDQRLRAEIAEKDKAIEELKEMSRAAAAERTDVIDDMEESHRTAQAEKDYTISNLMESLRMATKEAKEGQKKIADVASIAAAVEAELRKAKDALAEKEATINRLKECAEQQKETILNEKKTWEKEAAQTNGKERELKERLETVAGELSALSQEKVTLQTALEAAREDKGRLEGDLGVAQQELDTISAAKTELEASLAEMTKKNTGLEAQLVDMASAKNTRQKVSYIQTVINERDRLNKELDALKKKAKN